MRLYDVIVFSVLFTAADVMALVLVTAAAYSVTLCMSKARTVGHWGVVAFFLFRHANAHAQCFNKNYPFLFFHSSVE